MTNPKPRRSSAQYPLALRVLVDSLDDKKIKELEKTDPKAYAWYLAFMEAEYGANPSGFYKTKKEQRRCYRDTKRLKYSEALGQAVYDIPLDKIAFAESPEASIIKAIDNRHILNHLEGEANQIQAMREQKSLKKSKRKKH